MDHGSRLLIYSHDSFGLGHLRRCRAIAHHLVQRFKHLSILILSGSPIIGSFDYRSRVDFVRVPGVIKLRNGEYTALNLHLDIDKTLEIRRSIIHHTAEVFEPDVFLVDKEPLGLRGEVRSTLEMLKARGTRCILGLRDVMDEPASLVDEWQRKAVFPALQQLYDEIWVYGLPQICDPLEGIDLPKSVRRKMTYTGYLNRSLPQGPVPALPLQKIPRENGGSAFVDDALRPFPDQWTFLASIQLIAPHDIEPTFLRATGCSHPLDVTFITEEDQQEPWKRTPPARQRLPGPMPASLMVTLANLLYFDKAQLPQALANRLIRLAAFQNPEFYRAQAMRLPVWDEPRVIGCAENFPNHIALPRGSLDAAQELLRENGIRCELRDERFGGESLDVSFAGTLRLDQEVAVSAMLRHDTGILCAPTAFGKTVTAAAVIARRGVNTLVLVHRTELLKQWQLPVRSA